MIKTSLSFVVLSCLLMACSSSKKTSTVEKPNTLTSKQKNDGWVVLFDGTSTNGWHTYNKNVVNKNWKVVDGALVMDTTITGDDNGGDIVTNKAYKNFDFKTEWKISPGGNSGIIFDVKESPEFEDTYRTGAEMQVLDNISASDNKKGNHLAGLLYDLSGTPDLSKPKPVGEWNQVEIIQKDGHLTFYFNGVKTLDLQQGSDEWKQMVDNSKFKTWPGFMTSPDGKIAFQDHGHEVSFRNVMIKEL
jgi:hypothetical protein